MRIAVCDDEENVRAYIRSLIERQGGEHEITEYSSGARLLRQIQDGKGNGIDILFLDIALDDMDGMAVAGKLRQIQADSGQAVWGSLPLIIFVTGYSSYMPEAFAVSAFQFLIKPVKETDFKNVFAQAVRECSRISGQKGRAAKKITVGNKEHAQTIKTDDILYIESSNHKIFICLSGTRVKHYGKISDLERDLEPDFFRVHRGYLVNLNRIDHYDRTDVYMDNGDRLIISRYKYQNFVEAYMRHIAEERE